MIWELSALLALLLLSAFFSLAESAITALPLLKMKQITATVPALSRPFGEWLAKPQRLLITLLIGNNLAGVSVSSLAAVLAVPLEKWVPEQALEIGVWLVTTAVLLVFAEIIPKIVGRVYAERVSVVALPLLARVAGFFAFLLRPLRRAGPAPEHMPVNPLMAVSLEELSHMIGESEKSGAVPQESGEMMHRVVSLQQRTAADILVPAAQVDMVPLDVLERGPGAAELFTDLLVETGRTRVPVTRAGVPVGYIRVLDILKSERARDAAALNALIRPAKSVPPTKPVADLLTDFQSAGEHIAFVEDEHGPFLGLVTLEDVLEEIVGDILDEYDLEQKKT